VLDSFGADTTGKRASDLGVVCLVCYSVCTDRKM